MDAIPIPTIPIPTIPIPTIPIPTIPIPTIPIPTIRIPTIPIPTIPIRTIPIPTIRIPTVPIPTIPIPTIRIPTIPIPTIPIFHPEESMGMSTTVRNKVSGGLLRCRKCRKCVANSGCIIKDQECIQHQDCIGSSVYHGLCPIWHMDVEAIPHWMKQEIEKVRWTAGRLNCHYCGARLGAFNFVESTECPCGQLVIIHLSKSRVDYETVRPPKPFLKLLPTSKDFNKESTHMVSRNQTHLAMDSGKTTTERLDEALCLEVPSVSRRFVCRRTVQSLAQFSLNTCSESKNTVSSSHRNSSSLDCNKSLQVEKQSSLFNNCTEAGPSFFNSSGDCTKEFYRSSSFIDHHTSDVEESPVRVSDPPENLSTAGGVFNSSDMPPQPTNEDSTSIHGSATIYSTPSDLVTREGFMQQQPVLSPPVGPAAATCTDSVTQRLTKREINKLKSIRRKQRKREKWLHQQKQAHKVSANTDEENKHMKENESYICAVCLDVYFNPYMCYPCRHIFCEPCLRTLARDNPTRTSCPLCRTTIARVYFQSDLDKSAITLFPNEYLKRKESFQRANCAKWPLPSCNRVFRVFGGFSRNSVPVARRQFPHGAHRLDFEDETRGWRFDMDMVIIYIYSVNWVIGFIIFCFLCYFLFPLN
ncbi:E3 ubiquitin-protein ligase RNF180 [Pelodytes ibericus]